MANLVLPEKKDISYMEIIRLKQRKALNWFRSSKKRDLNCQKGRELLIVSGKSTIR